MLHAEVVDDPKRVDGFFSSWDALAVACARPYCAPAWMMAWWRHLATSERALRVVAVFDDEDLVGVGPFFVDTTPRGATRWRLLASQTSSRIEPLARPGREGDVAPVMVEAIANAHPRPDLITFEGTVGTSPWPDIFRTRWPGKTRPLRQVEMTQAAPIVPLAGQTFHEWFARRSKNFREIRRRGRRIVEKGGFFRVAKTPEEARIGVAAFARLHHSRWKSRGGSGVLDDRVEAMVADAAAAMAPDLRMRLWTIEVEGKIVAAEIFIAAGGEVSNWLGGFDEAWARYGPSLLLLLQSIEQAWELGDARFDLGTGPQEYKGRFTDDADVAEWSVVVPGLARPLARPALIPWYAGRQSFGRLSPALKQRIRSAARRGR
jgi:CelD/BcsL family acetyltransferase involved in cellulose biosynthesis